MPSPRATAWLLPLAVLVFTITAVLTLRGLPAEVPLRVAADGTVERALEAKPFQSLVVGLVLLLTILFGLARWLLLQPEYDPAGDFTRHPHLRPRMLVALDLLGAAGITLVTWTMARCASASRAEFPELGRATLLVPFLLLLAGAALAYGWVRRARQLPPAGGA